MLHSIFNSITLSNNNQQQQLSLTSSGEKKVSINSIKEETTKQSTIVATEVNLQAIAMENNLN